MANMVERYLSEVGRYVPGKEREEIKKELRSQIHDQLEDRYGKSPSDEQIAAVLTELGNPRRMAASYGSEQYLIGPDLFPSYVRTLQAITLVATPITIVVIALVGYLTGDGRTLQFYLRHQQ